jgi:hypothetical protein
MRAGKSTLMVLEKYAPRETWIRALDVGATTSAVGRRYGK